MMVHVIKADGTSAPFDESKIVSSLNRAGVPPKTQKQIIQVVESKLYENIPTYDIYDILARAIAQSPDSMALAKYSLKQAIMMLGPTGYPFEDYIAKVYEEYGYSALTRQILQGKCVTHETDVILEKDGKRILIEAKFHNNPGTRSDVKVTLYVKSRFDDLKDLQKLDEVWVVTNTKTTTDANQYGLCAGVNVISWDYPKTRSLREMIENGNLYPITILTTLSVEQKARLLANHVSLCKDIKLHPKLIDLLLLKPDDKKKVMNEINFICQDHTHKD